MGQDRGMKKIPLLFILGMVVLPCCFSQNLLMVGGEFNPLDPLFWNGGIGFNIEVLNEHLQNDTLLAVGGIRAENEEGERPQKILVSVKDKFFYSLNGRYLGLRAGISAAFGVYDLSGVPKVTDFFFSIAGLAGICILPKSLISVTLDICPGYAVAFRLNDAFKGSLNELGFMLPISLGVQFNIDKL
jgi:hypothetical protein